MIDLEEIRREANVRENRDLLLAHYARQAAAEIERLRAENGIEREAKILWNQKFIELGKETERLRAALVQIKTVCDDNEKGSAMALLFVRDIVRATLGNALASGPR